MPYLLIQTNAAVQAAATRQLLTRASRLVAEQLGKPERYVMVAVRDAVPMAFAGSDAPTAYLELKSIGLPVDETEELSAALCGLLHEELGLAQERVFIEFADAPRRLWGWNGGTF